MKLKSYIERTQNIPKEVRGHVKYSMDILDRINELLHEKFDGKQKLLAEKMGKTEAEISKWINGNHNFTLKTISKLEAAFGAEILAVCSNKDESTYELVAVLYNSVHKSMKVTSQGLEEITDYTSIELLHGSTTEMNETSGS